MKKSIILPLILIARFVMAQEVIVLTVDQPPELAFEISESDTAIVKGNSVVLGTGLQIMGGSGTYEYVWTPSESLNDATTRYPVATPSESTTYFLTVFDSNGCSFSTDFIVNVQDVSVAAVIFPDDLPELQAHIYPNPGKGTFSIQISGNPSERVHLNIFNSEGRFIRKINLKNFNGKNTETIRLDLPPGLYYFEVANQYKKLKKPVIIL